MQEGTHARGVIVALVCAAAFEAAVVFGTDRLTKTTFAQPSFASSQTIIPRVLETIQHHNFGIIANFPLPPPVTILVTLFVLALVATAILRAAERGALRAVVALGILFGGALGNLYDRITMGYVFDWLLLFERSAINLADVAIAFGAISYVLFVARPRLVHR